MSLLLTASSKQPVVIEIYQVANIVLMENATAYFTHVSYM